MPNENPSGAPWTVLKTLQWTTAYFKERFLDHPLADAEILLSHTLDCRRIDLYLRYDQPLNQDELTRYRQMIKRRVNREPVAYILGYKEFWSLRFDVNPAVLIPRPDTECLVEIALSNLPASGAGQGHVILELGVGSGAISVALAHERPGCRIWASDLRLPVVEAARDNSRRHHVDHRIHFFLGRWFEALPKTKTAFDMVVANPPYIPSGDIQNLAPDIRRFEPIVALDGGPDGLDCITHIIHSAHHYLKPHGKLILEIGFDQKSAVEAIGEGAAAYDQITFHKDYGGHYRVVQLRKRGP